MASLTKAYNNHMPQNLSSHHFRPSNLQNAISLFAITTPSSPSIISTDPCPLNPNKPQFGPFFIPTVAIAASTFFFMRLRRNPPIVTAPLDAQLELGEEGSVKELKLKQKPNHIKSLHFYKLEEGTIVGLMDVYESNDYKPLRARIRSSAEWLGCARRELDELIERDPGRVMEYSQVVDELMEILKDMEVYIEKCEKENVKGYLRSCNRLLARVRKMEGQILDALKNFQENEEGGGD